MTNPKSDDLTLAEISQKYDTDKASTHIQYLHVYESIFGCIRHENFNFLEIGTYLGGSVRMWREYLTKATIFSIEHPKLGDQAKNIFDAQPTSQDNIFISRELKDTFVCIGDTNKVEINNMFPSNSLNIIIDDGDHDAIPQIITLLYLFPKLSPGGIYFIEDIKGPMYTAGQSRKFPIICELMDCFNSEIRMFSSNTENRPFGDNNILGIIRKPHNEDEIHESYKKLNDLSEKYFKRPAYTIVRSDK